MVVLVHLGDVFDEGDGFSADQLGVLLESFRTERIGRVSGLGGVNADVAEGIRGTSMDTSMVSPSTTFVTMAVSTLVFLGTQAAECRCAPFWEFCCARK